MGRWSRWAGIAAAAGLGAIAVLHAVWMFTRWPLESDAEFAEVVVGTTDGQTPPVAAAGGVAVLLGVAAWLVWRRSLAAPSDQPRYVRVGAWTVAVTLLLRGSLGLLVSGLDLTTSPERYDLWDLRLYSPLSITLGALSLAVAMSGERFASRRAGQTIWAGRILLFIAMAHVVGWTDFASDQLSGWLEGSARESEYAVDQALTQSEAYFWALPGSFAPAGLILGALLLRLGRSDTVVPAFVGWGLAAWAVVATFILPSPAILVAVPGALIVLAAREPDRPRPPVDAEPAATPVGAARR